MDQPVLSSIYFIHIHIHIASMATASKSRSRMVTPPPKSSAKGGGPKMYSREEKQQLLDNFDCEGMSIVYLAIPGPLPLLMTLEVH
jgi:hypothetical protein